MAVLVDTSVWVQHFRKGVPELAALLTAGEVVAHSVVLGELAVGNLKDRADTLADLHAHPLVTEARSAYCLGFIELHRLNGLGLSWGGRAVARRRRAVRPAVVVARRRIASTGGDVRHRLAAADRLKRTRTAPHAGRYPERTGDAGGDDSAQDAGTGGTGTIGEVASGGLS